MSLVPNHMLQSMPACLACFASCLPARTSRSRPSRPALVRLERCEPLLNPMKHPLVTSSWSLPAQLKRCEPLREADVKLLCEKAVELLVEEANVQRVDAPVTICECSVFVFRCCLFC